MNTYKDLNKKILKGKSLAEIEDFIDNLPSNPIKEHIKKIFSKKQKFSIITVLIFSFLAFCFFIIIMTGFVQVFVVLSDSMQPVLHSGDVIVCKDINPDLVKISDVISFRSNDNNIITHRVIDILNNQNGLEFKTKGDANEEADCNPVYPDMVVGRMILVVPYLGYITQIFHSVFGFIFLIIVPAIIIICTEGCNIIKQIRK